MRVLVVSNNCFAKNNSNGRILGCLFKKIPAENVSQLYIVSGTNDFNVCSNYFLISDRMILNGLKSRKDIGKIITETENKVIVPKLSEYRTKYGRSSFTMLVRETLWRTNIWWTRKLKDWLKKTEADVIVFQCGDSPFMYKMVEKVRIYLNVPVVLFNTEYYYFLTESWLPVKDNSFFFNIFDSLLKCTIKRCIDNSVLSIYNSDWLKEHYDMVFKGKSKVIYQSSDYSNIPKKHKSENPNISYVGNLGFGRWEPLIDIANAIKSINSKWKIDVYGVVQSEEVRKNFNETECLDFHGSIPYDKAKRVLSESDLLVLTENQRQHFSKATEYGFSGKITDYLYSGIPILAYGADSNVGISYLKKADAAMVVTNKNELAMSIKKAIQDKEWRQKVVSTALTIAHKNHDAEKNAEKFKDYLLEVISDGDK